MKLSTEGSISRCDCLSSKQNSKKIDHQQPGGKQTLTKCYFFPFSLVQRCLLQAFPLILHLTDVLLWLSQVEYIVINFIKCCNYPELGSAIACFGAEEIVLPAFDATACAGVVLNKNSWFCRFCCLAICEESAEAVEQPKKHFLTTGYI